MVKSVLFPQDPLESGVALWTAAVHRAATYTAVAGRECQ